MADVVIVNEPQIVTVDVSGQHSVTVEVGFPGPPGLSAYHVAVANGFAGDIEAWLASLAAPSAESTFEVDLVTIYNLYK